MKWVQDFDLVLLDFDGLLVNTEALQLQAYRQALAQRGFELNWDFITYCQVAHRSDSSFKEEVYALFPKMKEADWHLFYAEKKALYTQVLKESTIELMPGAEGLIERLLKAQIPSVVVTHSSLDVVSLIRQKVPLLNRIDCWITREDYRAPKPHPDGYFKALQQLQALTIAKKGRAIGFEDSPRGLLALLQTPIQPVLICPPHLLAPNFSLPPPAKHYRSFLDLPADNPFCS